MARVLIVDDSPTEMYRFKEILKRYGYGIIEAKNGAEGVAKAREEKPDVVLMDVVMPGMNGFQATRQLSKEDSTATIPIVLLTTKGAETDKVWGMRQGATDYIVKPVKEDDLVNRLRSAAQG